MAGKRKANPRRTNGYRRSELRKQVAAQGLPCALCGKAIDYSLPAGHPMSFELDEKVPVSKGGSPYDPSNVQPAHRECNRRAGNKPRPVQGQAKGPGVLDLSALPMPTSQEW